MIRPAGDFDRSYAQDMSILRQPWHWGLLLVGLLIVFTIPLWGNVYIISTTNQIIYTVVALQGLNLLTGYAGQISLGQAAFMLVGGYISALTTTRLGLPFSISIITAAIGTGLFGLLFGLPSLRVKGFYLAMATLAAQFIIPWLSRHTLKDYLGGSSGRIDVPVVEIAGISFSEVSQFLYLSLMVLLVTTILTVNISRTKLGRAFVSVRDNDLAAELLGIRLFSYKLRAFFLAALFAGIAGTLKAHTQRGIGTEFGYGIDESIILLSMLVIGGLGTNLGPYFGAVAIILLEDVALAFGSWLATLMPAQEAALLTSFRPIFFGVMLMLFLVYEPRGLAHRWQLTKLAWRLRPFSR